MALSSTTTAGPRFSILARAVAMAPLSIMAAPSVLEAAVAQYSRASRRPEMVRFRVKAEKSVAHWAARSRFRALRPQVMPPLPLAAEWLVEQTVGWCSFSNRAVIHALPRLRGTLPSSLMVAPLPERTVAFYRSETDQRPAMQR